MKKILLAAIFVLMCAFSSYATESVMSYPMGTPVDVATIDVAPLTALNVT